MVVINYYLGTLSFDYLLVFSDHTFDSSSIYYMKLTFKKSTTTLCFRSPRSGRWWQYPRYSSCNRGRPAARCRVGSSLPWAQWADHRRPAELCDQAPLPGVHGDQWQLLLWRIHHQQGLYSHSGALCAKVCIKHLRYYIVQCLYFSSNMNINVFKSILFLWTFV